MRTLVETGRSWASAARTAWRKALTDIQVPATVQAILAARIDRLSPEDKRLLQSAAVIGKDVPFALLAGDRRASPRRSCAEGSPTCRRPSSSTRRASSPTSSTRSSTR